MEDYNEILRQRDHISSDSLKVLLKEGYQRFAKDNNIQGQAEMLYQLGNTYLSSSMLQAASDAYSESLSLFERLKDQSREADACSGLGTVLGRMGSYKEAAGYFMRALKIYEQKNDEKGLSGINIKLGTVNAYINNYDLARQYFLKALDYALRSDSINVVTIYSNIGAVHLDLGEFEESERYFKMALAYDRVPKNESSRALALINLGKLSKIQGKHQLAEEYYDQGMALADEHHLYEEAMAIAIYRVDSTSSATLIRSMDELSMLLDKAKELGMKYMQTQLLGKMIDIGKSLHQYKEALQWMEERDRIQLVLYDERKATEIANLLAVYELDKSRMEISELNTQVASAARERNRILVFSVVLVLGFLMALYFYLRSRRTNALLQIHERELSVANDVKDKLFSVISHDLKNAISTQPIVLELLKGNGNTDADRERLLEGLETSIQDVLYLLDILLNWGKMQIKGVIVQQVHFDVNEIIGHCVKLLTFSAGVKDIKIVNEIPAQTFVYADQDQFRFVVRNLISNAVKYSKKGGEVFVGLIEKPLETLGVEGKIFYVRDNGVGMDSEELETIFDVSRVSAKGTANEIGNSIALMLSREFIKENGGNIWVESEKEKGSVFYFSLPCKPGQKYS